MRKAFKNMAGWFLAFSLWVFCAYGAEDSGSTSPHSYTGGQSVYEKNPASFENLLKKIKPVSEFKTGDIPLPVKQAQSAIFTIKNKVGKGTGFFVNDQKTFVTAFHVVFHFLLSDSQVSITDAQGNSHWNKKYFCFALS